tara:strand:+ start:863 stop:1828 length:966 start_codon:yes stop_codon:yes gene_type:complete
MLQNVKFHKLVEEEKISEYLSTSYDQVTKSWFGFQNQWMRKAYHTFYDLEKYVIFLYLVKKTINFFSQNLISYDYKTYFKSKRFEIANFNVIEISKELNISKETARRKILELEKENIIKRNKKKLIAQNVIDRSRFKGHRPEESIKNVSKFLSDFSHLLTKEKLIDKKIEKEIIEKYILENFTYSWNYFLDMQIPFLLNWKKIFGDIETWYVFGQCWINKDINLRKIKTSETNYIFKILGIKNTEGINAMSISELTGIPRATVVRKLKKLLKMKVILIDDRKLYHPNQLGGDIISTFNNNRFLIAKFSTKIFNSIISKNLI